jgi:microcystin-dependent protein
MSQNFIGQVQIYGFNFAPRNTAFCNGQVMAISQNEALFSILGTTYGGNGQTTFALPNLQERGVMNWAQGPGLSNYDLGQTSGAATVTLSIAQIPQHNHIVSGYAGSTQDLGPTASGWLGNETVGGRMFNANAVDQEFAPTIMTAAGGSQPHENAQPYLVVNFCCTLFGIFPSRN